MDTLTELLQRDILRTVKKNISEQMERVKQIQDAYNKQFGDIPEEKNETPESIHIADIAVALHDAREHAIECMDFIELAIQSIGSKKF